MTILRLPPPPKKKSTTVEIELTLLPTVDSGHPNFNLISPSAFHLPHDFSRFILKKFDTVFPIFTSICCSRCKALPERRSLVFPEHILP